MSTDSREKGKESENFHVWLKVWGGGGGAVCLPLGSSEPPLLTLHTHPLRLTLGSAHFGGLSPVRLWTWREPAVMALQADLCPWRWGPWRRESAL